VKFPRWAPNALLVVAVLLVVFGAFMLSFISEPSVVGRMHTAVLGIGVACIALGLGGGAAGVWMLIARRT
jgi:hypothetical protein